VKGTPQRHPATVGACVAIAADPEGVVAVEALALEFAARLAAAGMRTASRLRWRVGRLTDHNLLVRPPREPTGELHSMLLSVHEDDEATVWEPGGPSWVTHADLPLRFWPSSEDFADGTTFGRIQREISASELWQSAALYGYRFDNGARPADLRDPFEPLFDVWRRGYAIDTLIDDTLVLLAPAA
jgi:hypothetical protein